MNRLWVSAAMSVLLAVMTGACTGGTGSKAARAAATTSLHEVWRWTAPSPAYVGMPEADGQDVAVTYGRAALVLLDAGGRPLWTATRDDLRDVGSLLVADLVVAATETGLASFDRARGSLRWETELGERANTPVVAGGLAVTSTWEGSLVAVDMNDGAVIWRVHLPGAAIGPPASDGHVVVTSWEAEDLASAGVVAVDATTGRRRWEVDVDPGGVSAPAVSPTAAVAVVVAGDVAAHGLALDDGAERWRTELEGAGSPEVPPRVVGGGAEILLPHRLGGLAMVSGLDGGVRWRVSSDGAAVRGGPAGPGPNGRFALPLDDGRLLLAGPNRTAEVVDPPGRISGVATGPDGLLLTATREAETDNTLSASTGW